MSNLDPVSMFWKMLTNAQEVNQLAFKVFLNTQKVQQSQNLIEQFMQECMSCIGDNTSASIKLFQSMSTVKTPEDFSKLQEKMMAEYSEKNIEHVKKLLTMYNNLLQESYRCAKENADDLTSKFTESTSELTKKFTENVNKFSEVNPFMGSGCSGKQQQQGNKRHTNATEENR